MAEPIAAFLYLGVTTLLSAGLLVFVRYADRYEREPWKILILSVIWGAVPAVVLSCVAEVAFETPVTLVAGREAAAVVGAVIIAPAVEEAAKALALLFVVLAYRSEFDDVLDGMVYGAAVGIGFSFVEDGIYFIGALTEAGWSGGGAVFALRNVGFILNHSLFTAVTGIGFGLARIFHKNLAARLLWPLAGLAGAAALHALHNLLAHFQLPGLLAALLLHWAGGLGLLCLLPLLWALERRWILQRLAREVREGHIPAAALAALPFSGRGACRIHPPARRMLRSGLVALAFHRRSAEDGWAEASPAETERLRETIRDLAPGGQEPAGPHRA